MSHKAKDGEDWRDEDHEEIIQKGLSDSFGGGTVLCAGFAAECCAGIRHKHEHGGFSDEWYDGDRL